MRRLTFALLLAQAFAAPAFALSGATPDGEDRFPFVVEINLNHRLICSGTVLFPRIVVTSAHCVQDKVEWRGGQVFVDHYLPAAQLSITVTHRGKMETHDVAEITVSPDWRGLVAEPAASQRFAYDIALIITKEPIDVGLPPSLLKLAGDGLAKVGAPCPDKTAEADKNETLKEALQRLTPHGVVVAFGAERCSFQMCGDAGVRRYHNVAIRESADCFNDNRGRPRYPPLSAEFTAELPLAVWCMESSVLPGDSGGALLVEGPLGELYYLGVISAQQGRFIALADTLTQKRSLATALYPSLDFILDEARKLGYAR